MTIPIAPTHSRTPILASKGVRCDAAIKPKAIAVATEGAKGEG